MLHNQRKNQTQAKANVRRSTSIKKENYFTTAERAHTIMVKDVLNN